MNSILYIIITKYGQGGGGSNNPKKISGRHVSIAPPFGQGLNNNGRPDREQRPAAAHHCIAHIATQVLGRAKSFP